MELPANRSRHQRVCKGRACELLRIESICPPVKAQERAGPIHLLEAPCRGAPRGWRCPELYKRMALAVVRSCRTLAPSCARVRITMTGATLRPSFKTRVFQDTQTPSCAGTVFSRHTNAVICAPARTLLAAIPELLRSTTRHHRDRARRGRAECARSLRRFPSRARTVLAAASAG